MPMSVDARVLAGQRRFNRRLALAPRVRYRHAFAPRLARSLPRVTQASGG